MVSELLLVITIFRIVGITGVQNGLMCLEHAAFSHQCLFCQSACGVSPYARCRTQLLVWSRSVLLLPSQADVTSTERQVVAIVWRDIQSLLGCGETAAEVTVRSVHVDGRLSLCTAAVANMSLLHSGLPVLAG